MLGSRITKEAKAKLVSTKDSSRQAEHPLQDSQSGPLEEVDGSKVLDAALAVHMTDNTYFIRGGKIVRSASGGGRNKTLTLASVPKESWPDGAQVVGGRLAISFAKPAGKTARIVDEWMIVDPENGRIMGRYAPGPDFRGSRLCYLGRSGFTYLTIKNGHPYIARMALP